MLAIDLGQRTDLIDVQRRVDIRSDIAEAFGETGRTASQAKLQVCRMDLTRGRHRFRAVMVGAFAALAVMLAMVGVFGILAYSVQQRVRDFGVRRALGATSNDVMRLVVGDALRVIAIGAAIGLVLAAASGRLIASMLFGVQPLDLTTFALVTVVLSVTATLSVAGPAWRAARIDPSVALRSK